MNYTPVIGLEIHVVLNTKTKMFCGCSADYFGKKPNTHTCPVCLGLPGALPFTNREALEKCIMTGLALNCKVSENSYFERKNYFYPDLPKGYQISQYRKPICADGYTNLTDGPKIRINRVHIEEDTGKLFHPGAETLIDFNRSGVPLVEIVTEPVFEDVSQVVEFAKKFQQTVRDLGVSNADMEKGELRLEANVSVRKIQNPNDKFQIPDYRIELKNINSFRFMQHAIEYEIKRQAELLDQGVALHKETRGWDEDKKETYPQRQKEEAHDYRYFPEPDLQVIGIRDGDRIRVKMPKLSGQKISDLVEKYGISAGNAWILESQGKVDYFEEIMLDRSVDAIEAVNAIINKRINAELTVEEFKGKLKEAKGGSKVSDEDLEVAVLSVIKHNEKAVGDYKKGKESVLQFLVGQVMRVTKGAARVDKAQQTLLVKLKNG